MRPVRAPACEQPDPAQFERYEEILFVGGGIGITPLHSSFRCLYQLAKHNHEAMPCKRVHLIWCARTPEIFELFEPTLSEAAQDDLGGKFKFSLFCDMAPKGTSCPLPYEHGRPDLSAHIAPLAPLGMSALVFVSRAADARRQQRRALLTRSSAARHRCARSRPSPRPAPI